MLSTSATYYSFAVTIALQCEEHARRRKNGKYFIGENIKIILITGYSRLRYISAILN